MKKICLMAVLAIMVLGLDAQTFVKKDSLGNYITMKSVKTEDKKTGEFFKDSKGIKYPIYVSSNGKYYVIRTSKKTGKEYKSYLKLEN